MSIIKTHNITLYGKTKNQNHYIALKPLSDKHLPLLYKWNADPEVTYWCEGNEGGNDEESVHSIYGYVSQIAYCFLIEADGKPIGDCWLEHMNIPEVSAIYPNLDVRRIDMMIGEKDWWGKGVGSALVGMLTDYAFEVENVNIMHIPSVFDYNIRSQKTFLKNGYNFLKATDVDNPKMKQEYHYTLTKTEYRPCYKITYDKVENINEIFVFADYVDFFNEELQTTPTDFNDYNEIVFLKPDETEHIKSIDGICVGQTRGFFREEDGFIDEWLKENDIIAIKENNILIGYCLVSIYDSGTIVWVRRIAVRPEYQGRGYGRKLLEQAIVYGRTKGAKRGFLHTDSSNSVAINLYNKYNFFARYYDESATD